MPTTNVGDGKLGTVNEAPAVLGVLAAFVPVAVGAMDACVMTV
jgi:hypothetical protein